MAKSRIDLDKKTREESIRLLEPLLAGATDLMLSTKEAHWNVKGPTFIALHELFDKFNEQAGEHVDDLAERVVQLGGHAHGTLASVAKTSPLAAYPDRLSKAADHLDALAEQTAALGSMIRKGIDQSAEAGDAGTADLLTAVSRDLDKRLWFIEAHLNDKG